MKIVVAEDDKSKMEKIVTHVNSVCTMQGVSVEVIGRTSYQSCLEECIRSRPDLLVLDMSMPTFDIAVGESGGRPRHFAGRDILRELRRKQISIPSIVVTGFGVIGEGKEQCTMDELTKELAATFSTTFLGTVIYTSPDVAWKARLAELLAGFLKVTHDKNSNSR